MRLILLIIYSPLVLSLCTGGIELPLDQFIKKLEPIAKKPWASASEAQIKEYTCKKEVLTVKEMSDYLMTEGDLSKELDLLLNKKKSSRFDEIKTDLSNYDAQKCADDICKAKKVFGETEGIELLYMLKKYGLNGSHLVHRKTKPWKSSKLKLYLKGLSAIPDFMLPIDDNKQFTLSSTDSSYVADSSITFYDGINKLSDEMVTYTSFHEMAHYISGTLHTENDSEWMLASGWIKNKSFTGFNFRPRKPKPLSFDFGINKAPRFGSIKKPLKPLFNISSEEINQKINRTTMLISGMINNDKDSIISRYAEVNPLEDIAESMTAYRFNSAKLKEVSPKRYDYIKNKIFLGVEYLDNSKCKAAESKKEEFKKLID